MYGFLIHKSSIFFLEFWFFKTCSNNHFSPFFSSVGSIHVNEKYIQFCSQFQVCTQFSMHKVKLLQKRLEIAYIFFCFSILWNFDIRCQSAFNCRTEWQAFKIVAILATFWLWSLSLSTLKKLRKGGTQHIVPAFFSNCFATSFSREEILVECE